MWIVKVAFLGIWLFSFGTLAFLYLALLRKGSAVMVDVNVVAQLTTRSPVWWIAAVMCIALGLFITRSWSGRPLLWVALAVTELIPVGLIAMFFALVSRNNEMLQKMQNMK